MNQKDHPPSRTAEQFVVRFPDGMRDRIAEVARESGRSMNAEIVSRLQKSFESVGDEKSSDKLAVAVITLKLVQRLVDDADLQSNIGEMLKFISGAGESTALGEAETIEMLVKKSGK